jgi:hypothetical protein
LQIRLQKSGARAASRYASICDWEPQNKRARDIRGPTKLQKRAREIRERGF